MPGQVLALAAEALATDQANPDGSNALAALHDDPYITELKYRGALRRLAQVSTDRLVGWWLVG